MTKKVKTVGIIVGKDPSKLFWPAEIYRTTAGELLSSPETLVGLELEIEGWRSSQIGAAVNGFAYHADNSLRNNGVEYVTAPTRIKHLSALLGDFYSTFKVTDVNYSERCSTHVHLNVCDMTLDQLACLCLVYQVFERMLFNFVGNDRDKNIFCVPWSQANVNVNLVDLIKSGKWRDLQRWSKYTALNLLPVQTQGTVEFRHLHGTCSIPTIMQWVNLIGCMREWAMAVPLEEATHRVTELNTTSAYEALLQSVFGNFSRALEVGDYRLHMENGVIDAKLMLTNNVETTVAEVPPPGNPTRNISTGTLGGQIAHRRAGQLILDDLIQVNLNTQLERLQQAIVAAGRPAANPEEPQF